MISVKFLHYKRTLKTVSFGIHTYVHTFCTVDLTSNKKNVNMVDLGLIYILACPKWSHQPSSCLTLVTTWRPRNAWWRIGNRRGRHLLLLAAAAGGRVGAFSSETEALAAAGGAEPKNAILMIRWTRFSILAVGLFSAPIPIQNSLWKRRFSVTSKMSTHAWNTKRR